MMYTMRKSREAWALNIGALLAAKLKQRGLTQSQIAAELSISQAWVSRVLHGQFTERSAVAQAMCARLGVPFVGKSASVSRVPVSRRRLERLSTVLEHCSDGQVADLITALTALKRRRART